MTEISSLQSIAANGQQIEYLQKSHVNFNTECQTPLTFLAHLSFINNYYPLNLQAHFHFHNLLFH